MFDDDEIEQHVVAIAVATEQQQVLDKMLAVDADLALGIKMKKKSI